jgi:hypothetical protein
VLHVGLNALAVIANDPWTDLAVFRWVAVEAAAANPDGIMEFVEPLEGPLEARPCVKNRIAHGIKVPLP